MAYTISHVANGKSCPSGPPKLIGTTFAFARCNWHPPGPLQSTSARRVDRLGIRVAVDILVNVSVRFWIFRACVFAKHSDWRSQRVFRCDRGVERENRKICGIFFTSVQVTPILNTAYAAMLKDTSGGTCIIWKSENIANHHFVHIHCYMLLSLQVSNNWPTDYLPLKISSISDRSFFRYGFRGL